MKKDTIFRIVLVLAIFLLVYQFGIKPLFSKNFIYDSRKNNTWAVGNLPKEKGIYDLIVVGEEPEGIAAAVSAARLGAKTLLIAAGKDLGGNVARSLQLDFEVALSAKGVPIVGGIFGEFYDKLGKKYSAENYLKTVSNLIKAEKNVELLYDSKIVSPIVDNNTLTGIKVSSAGKEKTYLSKRFIDATREGTLLIKCKVPYFVGSEDLNMKASFLPAKLNFVMEGVNFLELNKKMQDKASNFYPILHKYEPSHLNVTINNFKAIDMGDSKVLIQGIEVNNINVLDGKTVIRAYKDTISEVKDFSDFLKAEYSEFKDSKLVKTAGEFFIEEKLHFKGEHLLSVNEALENTDFTDKIALASSAIEGGKFASGLSYIIGKPTLYSIPLGCIIPKQIDNLLMVGSKISFSSLASTSAGKISTGMTVGESAGVVSVYSITKKIKPREILDKNNPSRITDVVRVIKRQGVTLQDFKIKNANTENECYPAVRELNSLGLISGGMNNNYEFEKEARQQDLAILLLNGIYRLSPDKYNLELDSRLRPLFTKDKLTREKAVAALIALYDLKPVQGNAYDKLCEAGYINGLMKLRINNKKVLTMDDVFLLADWNIKMYTGKVISN